MRDSIRGTGWENTFGASEARWAYGDEGLSANELRIRTAFHIFCADL